MIEDKIVSFLQTDLKQYLKAKKDYSKKASKCVRDIDWALAYEIKNLEEAQKQFVKGFKEIIIAIIEEENLCNKN
jgi:hypothetical protein